MSQPAADPFAQARARWLAAQSPQASPPRPPHATDLPAALQADLQALRAAGLDFTILPGEPTPQPAPVKVLAWGDVERLDARDPRRALYQYQQAYSLRGLPVPAAIVGNLRAAMRDEKAHQKARQRLFSP